jgi:hypothetical protein
MEQNPPGSSHGQPPRQPPVYDTNHGGHYGTSANPNAQRMANSAPLTHWRWLTCLRNRCRSDSAFPTRPRVVRRQLTREQLSGQGYAPVPELYTGLWANVCIIYNPLALPMGKNEADPTALPRSTRACTARIKTSSRPTGSRSSATSRLIRTTTSCTSCHWRASRRS